MKSKSDGNSNGRSRHISKWYALLHGMAERRPGEKGRLVWYDLANAALEANGKIRNAGEDEKTTTTIEKENETESNMKIINCEFVTKLYVLYSRAYGVISHAFNVFLCSYSSLNIAGKIVNFSFYFAIWLKVCGCLFIIEVIHLFESFSFVSFSSPQPPLKKTTTTT